MKFDAITAGGAFRYLECRQGLCLKSQGAKLERNEATEICL